MTIPRTVVEQGELDERIGPFTVEYRADKKSSKIRLLSTVQPVWDLWGIRVIGPGRSPVVRHDLNP